MALINHMIETKVQNFINIVMIVPIKMFLGEFELECELEIEVVNELQNVITRSLRRSNLLQ